MPTYCYECLKCGHEFDRVQSIMAETLKRCPKCRGKLRRVFGAGAGILFKGSGFYQTDYRSDNYKQGKTRDEKPASDSATKTSNSPSKKETAAKSAKDL